MRRIPIFKVTVVVDRRHQLLGQREVFVVAPQIITAMERAPDAVRSIVEGPVEVRVISASEGETVFYDERDL